MLRHRVIPILLHDEEGLVKTTNFKNPIYIGDPLNAVRIFNHKFVDELVLLDISRSKRDVPPNFELAARIASECFMPFAYGGGIRNIIEAKELLSLGVDKLVIQSAAFKNLKLISEISEFSGSQSISVSIDVVQNDDLDYFAFHAALNQVSPIPLEQLIKQVQLAGAGELILTAVNNEGKMQGYDLHLIEMVRDISNIPIVANGGAGSFQHFTDAFAAGADAVAAGSFFVFYSKRKGVLISYPDYEKLESLLGG